jgi:ribose transport system substrate-binding protein
MKSAIQKKMSSILVISMTLIVMAMFPSCDSKSNAAPANKAEASAEKQSPFIGDGDSERYVMVTFVSGVDYWVPVYEMFKEAGKQLNVKTEYKGTPEYDLNQQLAVFEQVMATNPTGIALCPMNADAFIEPINRAIDQGIKIITFATDSPISKRSAFITSDNKNEGYMAADALAEKIGGKGKFAVLENPGQLNHEIRIKSFIERIETNWPDIEVVSRVATNQDANKAYQAVMTVAQAHPDIKGFFMPEASSGMGASQAAIELDSGIQILCVDINNTVLDMIKAGKLFGAIQPNVGVQGYYSMLTLFLSVHNLIDPMNNYKKDNMDSNFVPLIDNGLDVVTIDNVESFYVEEYLERRGSKRFK